MVALANSSVFRCSVAAFLVLGSVFLSADPVSGKGDDTYRFVQGAGETSSLKLDAISGGVRWLWARPTDSKWDTALLGLRLHAVEGEKGEPWVEFSAGSTRVRQYLERGVQGLRWLNLTGLRERFAIGQPVEVVGHGVTIALEAATLRLFSNRLDPKERILILATHPDDAEIAAFGLYAGRNATIVTITCGNAGDANYADHFRDSAEQYRFKGYLRAVDSVTVPWQGGISPAHCFNLGYFDDRLQDMHEKPSEAVPERYSSNVDISVYRRANMGDLLGKGMRTNSWAHLVADLAEVFRKVRPTLIVMPHPVLDTHRDHDFTSVAAVEALEMCDTVTKGSPRLKSPKLMLYTNHAGKELYPYGPAGTSAPLPPWQGRELLIEGFYAHPLDTDLQRRKLFALDCMHDLRLSPAEQIACAGGSVKPRREDFPRVPAVDYFRRAPRPEELFFIFSRGGLRKLIRTFLEELKD